MKRRATTCLAALLLLSACAPASPPSEADAMCGQLREADASLLLDPVDQVGALVDPDLPDPAPADVEWTVRHLTALADSSPQNMRSTIKAYAAPLEQVLANPELDLATRDAARDLVSPHMTAAMDLALACPASS